MAVYRLTSSAEADISEIYEYSVSNFGILRADTYLDELFDAFALLADSPLLGVDVRNLKPGYRRHIHVSHLIYYRISGADIEILRILHSNQDPLRHLS